MFKIEKIESICVLIPEKSFDEMTADDVKIEVKNWLLMDSEIFVLDLKGVERIPKPLLSPFVLFQRGLKDTKKYFGSVHATSDLQKTIKLAGLEDVFNCVDSLDRLRTKAIGGKAKNIMDASFLNIFVKAATETLTLKANTKITAGKPFVKTIEYVPDLGIVGVMNIASDRYGGSVSMAFPKAVFLKVYENMMGGKHTEINSEIKGTCGELLKTIFEMAKTDLNRQTGVKIERAIPTVLSGSDVSSRQTASAPTIILPFETQAGKFYIEIVSEPNKT